MVKSHKPTNTDTYDCVSDTLVSAYTSIGLGIDIVQK